MSYDPGTEVLKRPRRPRSNLACWTKSVAICVPNATVCALRPPMLHGFAGSSWPTASDIRAPWADLKAVSVAPGHGAECPASTCTANTTGCIRVLRMKEKRDHNVSLKQASRLSTPHPYKCARDSGGRRLSGDHCPRYGRTGIFSRGQYGKNGFLNGGLTRAANALH